jgi:hypothetical protein
MGVLCDPIFWVVCWLLIGSPTAVQLTQITQLNSVFEAEMAQVISPLVQFHFYHAFVLGFLSRDVGLTTRYYGGITLYFVRR